jgi:hypothetical protein
MLCFMIHNVQLASDGTKTKVMRSRDLLTGDRWVIVQLLLLCMHCAVFDIVKWNMPTPGG